MILSGKSASPVSISDNDCCAAGVIDTVTGQTTDGDMALTSTAYNSNADPTASTDLLSPSGHLVHRFSGSPLTFSPDGRYLLLNREPAEGNPDAPVPEAVCDLSTFVCRSLPGEATYAEWLPNDDLSISPTDPAAQIGLGTKWWSAQVERAAASPAIFHQFGGGLAGINVVVPTTMMTRIIRLVS
jgi:hypothetical protein